MFKNFRLICPVLLVFAMTRGYAQQIVTTGPPPEIRAHVDALLKALNGDSAEAWEKMAQEHFSPDMLKKRTPEERQKLWQRMHGDLGKVTMERGVRKGPDAPLELHVKGSTGMNATLVLDLEAETPFRIKGMRVEVGGGADEGEPKKTVAAPQVSGKMAAEEISSALGKYFERMAADDVFSGVVLVAKDGSPVFQHAYGFTDRGNKVPNTMETRFNIGSINKTFTQTAISKLVEEGKLSLNDTVGKVLPDYPQELTRTATVQQLLNHTGGIADFFGDEFRQMNKDRFRSNADYFKLVSNSKPLFAPGARNQYCNGCYITLGEIIAKVSGMPYEKYVRENVFVPAGMTGAGPVESDAINSNVAMGYTRRSVDNQLRPNVFMHGATGSAAGGGYARAADLLAYDMAMRAGRLLKSGAREGDRSIAGGASGCSAVPVSQGPWTVVVLTNLDPRTGEDAGIAVAEALGR